MKKNKTSQSNKNTKKHSPNLNSNNPSRGTYNLDEYRNKKRNYYNPYADMGTGNVDRSRKKRIVIPIATNITNRTNLIHLVMVLLMRITIHEVLI